MIERLIEFSIRNRFLVIAAGLVLAVWGVYAVYHTPMDAIPDLSENQVIVFTEWPGHSPREIEDQVSYPLSLQLQGLGGVRVVRSSSDVNFSMISVIFEDGVTVAAARQQVAGRLAAASNVLPAGVTPQLAPDAAATGQIFWYTVEGPGYDLGRLRAVQDWYVRPQLNAVPGVAEVASVGGYPAEYAVEIDPQRLQAHGVNLGDLLDAVGRSNAAVGGGVIHKGNAEYVVRADGWLGAADGRSRLPGGTDSAPGLAPRPEGEAAGAAGAARQAAPTGDESDPDPRRVVRDLENVVVPGARGTPWRLADVATVSLAPGPRRGVLEHDGNEVTGGVVLMRHGENPLEVTRRLKQKILELQVGLPHGVRIVSFYDRTPLIENAVATVTGTLLEAIITATVCVLLVLLHFRTSLVIALTLPLAVLSSFLIMWALRRLGIADVQTNIMSLAGIAISIGVLVDSSIVMAENAMHHLKEHFGDRPVTGDTRALVLPALRTVGRPIFFSVVIMLLSFLPVFALGGVEGKMFHPLAFTKSFALIAVALLAVTLVPALCTIFIRGRLRREEESWLVRGVMQVYRPALAFLLDRPAAIVCIVGVTLLVGLLPAGDLLPLGRWLVGDRWPALAWVLDRWLFLGTLAGTLVAALVLTRHWLSRTAAVVLLLLIALVADQNITPLGREFITPLDEGMVMDMPITVPRASVTQSADDLKARDMVLCRFPEVDMVVGKAGRAETPTDPAPLDMIETMVNFRPQEFWPRRKLRPADAEQQARALLDALEARGLVQAQPVDSPARATLVNDAVTAALPLFDAQVREFAYQRNQEFQRELGPALVRFTVERAAGMMDENGALTRRLTPGDLLLLGAPHHVGRGSPDPGVGRGSPDPAHAEHLAMTPTLEDVTLLAQETAEKVRQLELLRPGADPLLYRPDFLVQKAIALHTMLGGQPPTFFTRLYDAVAAEYRRLWRGHLDKLNPDLRERGADVCTHLLLLELLGRSTVTDAQVAAKLRNLKKRHAEDPALGADAPTQPAAGHHHHLARVDVPAVDPVPALDTLEQELAAQCKGWLLLWAVDRAELAGFGGELDRVMQMPGWTNVWTMPIQNRVDMLSTGVNTSVGVRVLGRKLDDVVRASEEVAAVLKRLPGAADVVADPVRGKGYLEVHPDRIKAARLGVSVADVNELVETAVGGKVVTTTIEGRERHPVRVRYARSWRLDEDAIGNLLLAVPARREGEAPAEPAWPRAGAGGSAGASPSRTTAPSGHIPLSQVADIRIVEGPATIKSENGLLRNYVRLNVRGRSAADFVDEARGVVAAEVHLPPGVFLEWTGQFEHQARAGNTLLLIVPLVLGLIFLILYLTYHDLADAALMLLAVPGAVAGGVFFQWLFGYPFSVTVWVGYIACFGMATSTGIIMLVYLREAVARAGGLEKLNLEQLRQAVLTGAVHRLRPKLLTECVTILGLMPLLWASGAGAEVIRPMVVPVLGGLLIADEVIDLFLPVSFFWVRRRRWQRLHAASTAEARKKGTGPLL
jgi:Cu(I)/Ag(I) efflux system membrane protein CusA/SilA